MAFFDKLKSAAEKAKEVAAKAAAAAADMAEQAKEKQQAREQAQKDSLLAQSDALWELKKKQRELERKEALKRILNGDPNNERWDFLADATDEEIAQIEAMDVAKETEKRQERMQERESSGYIRKLMEDADPCDHDIDPTWHCVSYANQFYANCGGGMLCERKQRHKDNGDFDELLFPDSWEYLMRLSALEEGGPATRWDCVKDVIAEYAEAYLPAFADISSALEECIEELGLGKKNYKLTFLTHLGHKPEKMDKFFLEHLLKALKAPPTAVREAQEYYANMAKILDNPSLYRVEYAREVWDEKQGETVLETDIYKEFRYLVGAFDLAYNPELIAKHFAYPQVVNPEELFTETGEVKASGFYEGAADDYDTVFGVLEYWNAKSTKLAARNG